MNIEGARIYEEGLHIGRDCEAKIRKIVSTIKTLSPSPDVSLRIVRSGRTYEALLWGQADLIRLGAYNRGQSISQVLEKLHGRVKKECLKIYRRKYTKHKMKFHSHDLSPFAQAA